MSPDHYRSPDPNIVQRRPAETGGVAGAVGLLIGYIAGINDAGILVAIGVVVGFVPTAITWTVNLIRNRNP